nr:HNH endonuclease signature motif containing protein [Aureimonas sp. AU12]
MPVHAPRICSCGKTVASGKTCACRIKARAEADARRPSAAVRGYDAAWKRVRSDFLKRHPVCCSPGCGKPATEADHVVSVAERPDLRLSWSNLRPFCKPHHSQRTARDQGFARSGARTLDLPSIDRPTGGVGANFTPKAGDRLGRHARERGQMDFSVWVDGLDR